MWSDNKLRRLIPDAAFLGLALILSYLEVILPIGILLPLPGFKPGLANLAVLILAFTVSPYHAAVVSVTRVCLMALLFGNPVSFFFSLCGALLSLAVIFVLRKNKHLSFIGISALSAAAHNIGQLVAASVLFGPGVTIGYLPVMLTAATVTGGLCGLILNGAMPRICRFMGVSHD